MVKCYRDFDVGLIGNLCFFKVLASNIRSQVRKERETLNLTNNEIGNLEQETKKLQQALQQTKTNCEFHKVA